MKNVNVKQIILGVIVFVVGFSLLFGSTYVYDYFEGHNGREIIIVMFDLIIGLASLFGGTFLIVFGADNSN